MRQCVLVHHITYPHLCIGEVDRGQPRRHHAAKRPRGHAPQVGVVGGVPSGHAPPEPFHHRRKLRRLDLPGGAVVQPQQRLHHALHRDARVDGAMHGVDVAGGLLGGGLLEDVRAQQAQQHGKGLLPDLWVKGQWMHG